MNSVASLYSLEWLDWFVRSGLVCEVRYCNQKVGVVRLERRVDWFVAYAWVSK